MQTVKSRVVSFFADADLIPDIVRAIDEDVLPRYQELPHFVSFVALRSETGPRPEVVAISVWRSGLEGSEEISEAFRDEVHRVTGTTPSRRGYDTLRIVAYDADGQACVDLP